ncbi:isocitrate/isopropylmalate family dehydrogenase [Rhizobium sp. AU243]|uniref:isocitrate/isopropylmalate dehydrogenase family protein n=1 Tax=Rhizobium sp. AU243 TaxID=2303425 RepID=UPI0010CB7D6F|nr:isocitrate/isopropylmalate family dehydrogenase [Rhizobium sp. AU243]TKV70557.1 isocitrate/isopropylmalate dehydrogenase family protein [Rhizobium sp. AU243]
MRIAVLPGDDIGPEITAAALTVLEKADQRFGLNLDFGVHEVGMESHRRNGTTLPDSALAAAMNADGVLLGPGGMTAYPPVSDGGINIPGTVRKRLDLYANLRPARARLGLERARPGLDCLIARENTEGFYADRNMFLGSGEFMPTADCALSVRKVTRQASRRIAKRAFALAEKRRGHVTIVGKRHVLQITDGLFVEEAEAVAAKYPDVKFREVDIDAMVADIYTNPDRFDVILVTNMFGDILSNLAVALSGGLGLAAALNVGDERAAANAGHGSAPDIAGKGIANPSGLILSAAMLLNWWGERSGKAQYGLAAAAIEHSLDDLLRSGTRTGDLGGQSGTRSFADAIAANLREPNHSSLSN